MRVLDVDKLRCFAVTLLEQRYLTGRRWHVRHFLRLLATIRTSIIIARASTTNYYLIKSDFVIVATALHLLLKPSLATI